MADWHPKQWITLLALSFSVFMISLDVTVVSVALPAIQRELGLSLASLQWVVSAYSLSFGALLIAGGTLADHYGRRRVFSIGLVVFSLASAACGLAHSGAGLNAARMVQGVGAALMSSSSMALVASAFPGRDRASAYGVWGASLGLGLAFGPMLGGYITVHWGWHWVFLVNAPIGALILSAVLKTVVEAKDPLARRFDLFGLLSFSSGIALLIYALNSGDKLGWSSPRELALLALASGLLLAFVLIERGQERPLFDLRLFALPTFVGVSIVPLAASTGYWALFIYLPWYFDRVLQLAPAQAGITMLPYTLPMLIMPPLAARLSRVMAPQHQFFLGLLMIALGDMALAHAIDGGGALMWPLLLAGVGAGSINAQISSVAVSVVPVERAGMASGISATMRQIGYALAIAGLGVVLVSQFAHALDSAMAQRPEFAGIDTHQLMEAFETGRPLPGFGASDDLTQRLSQLVVASFVQGMRAMLWTAAAVSAVGALLALKLIRSNEVAA
ncbi:MFS transporter [Duganella aquatilis]|nr:MFS transporter [Duganella aquatilis]